MDTATRTALSHCWMRLTGPIFDKELRVCSRRKRYYMLRSIYLMMLAVLIVAAWTAKNASLGWQSSTYNVSRMAEVGRSVIISVVWLQFIASQIAAVLFFCNAISDEMNRGTLNVLMTTPVTALQIVVGKLLSKMLQLVLILALSLLTLSIVYSLGGVHWETVIASFFVTLTAVIFTSCMTLLCSGRVKRPHTVVLIMITFVGVYYAMGAPLVTLLSSVKENKGGWLLMAHPMAAMLEVVRPKVTGAIATGNEFSWALHCMVMLAISLALLGMTVIGLRRSMLTFAFEEDRTPYSRWSRLKRFFAGQTTGYPLELKHCQTTRIRHSRREIILFVLLTAGYVMAYCGLYFNQAGLGRVFFGTYTMTLWLIIFIRTMVGAATSITKEKENKTFSALLCCPMNNSQIIWGKAKQVYRSNFTGWAVIAINAASVYLIYSFIYPSMDWELSRIAVQSIFAVLHVMGSLIFIIGFGLYMSVRFKSSTAALVAALVGYLLWYCLRHLIMIIPTMISVVYEFYMISFYVRPFVDVAAGLFFIRLAHRSLRKYAF